MVPSAFSTSIMAFGRFAGVALVSTVIFVVPFFMEATLRFVAGAAQLEGVRLGIVSQESLEKLPPEIRSRIAGHWRINDGLDAGQIAAAIETLSRQIGKPACAGLLVRLESAAWCRARCWLMVSLVFICLFLWF